MFASAQAVFERIVTSYELALSGAHHCLVRPFGVVTAVPPPGANEKTA